MKRYINDNLGTEIDVTKFLFLYLHRIIKRKKMKQIVNPKLTNIHYPVGVYINDNLPIISEMAKSFVTIEEFKDKKINLVCTGSSGAIISAIFSILIPNETQIHHVKKDGEKSHHGQIDKISNENPFVFIDDFICEGITINRVYAIMKKYQQNSDFEFDCVVITDGYKFCDGRPKYLICGKEFVG
jgi:hypothetical protein